MTQRDPSRSAAVVAAHRAAEWLKPARERICHDPFAGRLIPEKTTVIGESEIPPAQAMAIFRQFVPGFHEFFLARTRFIDDLLEKALTEGLEQVVILGAGYDSRAHRIQGLRGKCPVFEVDHPATQAVKQKRLSLIPELNPDHARYIPADLEDVYRQADNPQAPDHQSSDQTSPDLGSRLRRHGFVREKPSFFIWEGVTMYLAPETVRKTLGMIAKFSAPGSFLVFDFTRPEVIQGTDSRPEARAWLSKARENKEPLQFGIDREAVIRLLEEQGFCETTVTGSRALKKAYFASPGDPRETTPILSLLTARK